MRENGLIERLREIFTGTGEAELEASRIDNNALTTSDAASKAFDVRNLIARLEQQAATSVMAGCVQLLGLDQVKERLGASWEAHADRALLIAQEALEAFLSPADIYRIIDESSFQICFESGDENYARFQVERISEAIERRIAAELGGAVSGLTVESLVAPVLCARIRDASDPLSALYSSLLEIRNSVNGRAINRHSIPALRHAGALFQPLWPSRDFGQTQNRCLLDTLAGAAAAKHLKEIEALEDLVEALANLDCVVFAKSVEGLHQALGEIKRATIVVPVHFQTLALEQQEFLDIAATLPLPYRRFVLLDLIGVPTATTGSELLKALKTGRTITDRIVLQMSPTDHRMDQTVRNLIWGVSMNLGELDVDDPRIAIELERFALAAAEQGIYSFAYGANTIGKAVTVVKAGFDYVGGSAVCNVAPLPRSHARFTPLFGDVALKSRSLDSKADLRAHPRFAPLDPNSSITLLDGHRHTCRIPNVSASGAVVLSEIDAHVGDYLVIGSIPAQVVRTIKQGFAVHFLEVQQQSAIEIALQTPVVGDALLESLRLLRRKRDAA